MVERLNIINILRFNIIFEINIYITFQWHTNI